MGLAPGPLGLSRSSYTTSSLGSPGPLLGAGWPGKCLPSSSVLQAVPREVCTPAFGVGRGAGGAFPGRTPLPQASC